LFAAVDIEPYIEYIDMPENLRDKYQYFTQADMGKLHESGFSKDFYALEEGVKDYANYLSANAHW
ncbi:MAG: ADP-L-glycero-D-mannoheptose-6-epimerase, partial [Candidatus Omnitrophica bacterium]|nr:ADP-L-glycero-D-mannoheptose-6-epimerase [Candidatus Omnitrophota bacterium]